MKAVLLSLICIWFFNNITAQVAINTTGAMANNSSILDASSTTKGVLIPRLSKANKNAISTPATGLLIYQDSPDSLGFHYYNGVSWVYLIANNILDTAAWKTSGNLGTDTLINFIGTTDNMALKFKQNNTSLAFWDNSKGNYYIGKNAALNNARTNIIAIGDSALFTNSVGFSTATHGTGNVAIGTKALFANTQGYSQTAIGFNALLNSTGSGVNSNTAIGFNTLKNLISASANTAIGAEAGLTLGNTAEQNVAIGADALRNGANPKYATAIGTAALKEQSTSGFAVTGIGYKAGGSFSNNDSSTFIGAYADATVGGLVNVTAIGAGARVSLPNTIVIGDVTKRLRVGIGTSFPSARLSIRGLGGDTSTMRLLNLAGNTIFDVKDSDSVRIGNTGNFIKAVIKFKILASTPGAIAAGTTVTQTFTITGAMPNLGAVAYISPVQALNDGIIIASVRVSATNTVEVKFTNVTASNITPTAIDYNIVVIQ